MSRRSARALTFTFTALLIAGAAVPATSLARVGTHAGGQTSSAAKAAPSGGRDVNVAGRGIRDPKAHSLGQAQAANIRTSIAGLGRPTSADIAAGGIDIQATGVAPTFATSSGAPAANSQLNLEGLDQSNVASQEPPDPWVAVGPNDVVQSVRTTFRFRDRAGASTAADRTVMEFFDLADFELDTIPHNPADASYIDGVMDPRFVYDAVHNKWLALTVAWHCDTNGATATDLSMGFLFVAVSLTDDPTGDYYHFYVQYAGEGGTNAGLLPAYPALGTSSNKIVLSANEQTLSQTAAPNQDCTTGTMFDSASLVVFDWANVLTYPGDPATSYIFDEFLGQPHFSLRPALAPNATATDVYVVGEFQTSATNSDVYYTRVTGTNAAGNVALAGERNITANSPQVGELIDPPQPQDPGGFMGPNIVDRRATDAVWQDNVLTFVSTRPCDPPGGSAETRACARVTQLDTSTNVPTKVQDVLIAFDDRDTFHPGAGISQSGILHVVYSRSGSTQGFTSYDQYQLPSDAAGEFSAAVLIANGGSVNYSGTQLGGYVGVAQDPRDTNAVWQGNHYAKSGGIWGTRVSELQTAGSTFVPVAPVRLLDTRDGTGLSGVFNSNVARTVIIAGRLGIPANATAITGNLTATNQTAAGFLAATPNPTNTPGTSTVNFPLGDVRANNLTSPLSSTGRLSIVYKAVAGKSTHVVLDVTGYFLDDDTAATYKTVSPVRLLDTRDGTGMPGGTPAKLAHGAPLEFPIAGQGGVPADAIAVTGNLTVVNQTRAGFVSLGPDIPAVPTTSTLNFPLNDIRANGVTVQLDADGNLSAVYRSTAGNTADVAFDVTGFYVDDLTGARFVAITPGRALDTRINVGLTGAFVSNTARVLQLRNVQGVPNNATAVAGNITVVGQTAAGYVSMTQNATNNPTTSTLNFPVADIRANGATGPLRLTAPIGTVGLTYKAIAGRVTHVLLDVTGYFR